MFSALPVAGWKTVQGAGVGLIGSSTHSLVAVTSRGKLTAEFLGWFVRADQLRSQKGWKANDPKYKINTV